MVNHPLDDAADHERSNQPVSALPPLTSEQREQVAINMVVAEFIAASRRYPAFNSAHEGYAILLEEVDELWDEIKKNDKTRSKAKMIAEAKQVGAMALRFMLDVCASEIEEASKPVQVERRGQGHTRIVTSDLSTIVVRFGSLTLYKGQERRHAPIGQQLQKEQRSRVERRKSTRRSGERILAVGHAGVIVVNERLRGGGIGPQLYVGRDRRLNRDGGRRQFGSNRRLK